MIQIFLDNIIRGAKKDLPYTFFLNIIKILNFNLLMIITYEFLLIRNRIERTVEKFKLYNFSKTGNINTYF